MYGYFYRAIWSAAKQAIGEVVNRIERLLEDGQERMTEDNQQRIVE